MPTSYPSPHPKEILSEGNKERQRKRKKGRREVVLECVPVTLEGHHRGKRQPYRNSLCLNSRTQGTTPMSNKVSKHMESLHRVMKQVSG